MILFAIVIPAVDLRTFRAHITGLNTQIDYLIYDFLELLLTPAHKHLFSNKGIYCWYNFSTLFVIKI